MGGNGTVDVQDGEYSEQRGEGERLICAPHGFVTWFAGYGGVW